MKISKIILILTLLAVTSCVESAIIASVGGGVVATREKTLKETRSDILITSTLSFDFVVRGLKNPGNSINFTVNEGRILLTGIVRDVAKVQLAKDVCWNVLGVKEVIDEIQIRNESMKFKDVGSAFFDYLITTQVETKLMFARDISWPNYKITTVNGVVYLLGISKSDFEMQRALTITSKVRGVEKVINHLLLRDDSRRHG